MAFGFVGFIVCASAWTVICTGQALLIWALVHFGENNHQYISECSERLSVNGFLGNPDFYGLGIRLGIYFQWIAQFLANCFLSTEWKSILGASIVFALALTVAVLLLTFEHECTFTAEIIVILFIFWGGFLGSYYGSPIMDDMGRLVQQIKFLGTNSAATLPFLLMQIFSLWFWIRLATAGEIDYSPTPGGTFYFLCDRVSARSKPPARFMVVLSAAFSWSTVGLVVSTGAGLLYWMFRECCCTPRETNRDHDDDSFRHSQQSIAAVSDTNQDHADDSSRHSQHFIATMASIVMPEVFLKYIVQSRKIIRKQH